MKDFLLLFTLLFALSCASQADADKQARFLQRSAEIDSFITVVAANQAKSDSIMKVNFAQQNELVRLNKGLVKALQETQLQLIDCKNSKGQ